MAHETIVEIKFGSHLYGTNTPSSDLDLKAVHIPDGKDILLQRVRGSVGFDQRAKEPGEKNVSSDIDHESYSLQKYLTLLSEGQTVALDMLFAPSWALTMKAAPLWRTIFHHRHRLITKKSSSFLGYCRTQANKYGIRGSRVAAVREAVKLLEIGMLYHSPASKLSVLAGLLEGPDGQFEFSSIVDQTMPNGTKVRHWEICNRKMPYTASIKSAHDLMTRMVAEYGERALLAERNEGIDWKALSHAVRVGEEAKELLQTGEITFPLPYKAEILAIKLGQIPYAEVAGRIEALLDEVERLAPLSGLPDEPDHDLIDELVWNSHAKSVESFKSSQNRG